MPIDKIPFQSYRTEEERAKDTRENITVSINKEERAWLEQVKLGWDLKSDSVALKFMAEIGKNVVFSSLSIQTWQYITREKRSRYSQFKDIQVKLDENVMQENQVL